MELLLNILGQVLNEFGAFRGNRKLPKKKLAMDEVEEHSPADTCMLGCWFVLVWLLSAYIFSLFFMGMCSFVSESC